MEARLWEPLELHLTGLNKGPLRFETGLDVARWAEREEARWRFSEGDTTRPKLNEHRNLFTNVLHHALEFERIGSSAESTAEETQRAGSNIQSALTPLVSGTNITSDHPAFQQIETTFPADPAAAEMILSAFCKDSSRHFLGGRQISGDFLALMVRSASLAARVSTDRKRVIHRERVELESLRVQFASELSELRARADAADAAEAERSGDSGRRAAEREEQWAGRIKASNDEWAALRTVYDNELALRAPTTYWADRARSSTTLSIVFGVTSALLAGLSLLAFFWLGFPLLQEPAPSVDSVILRLVPLVVPAFAAVWGLRVVTRLFSDNLQLARDARERETMVKTFLALMKDEQSGRALVTDQDRVLILHSLFRPSAIASVDDSPPVHWFDLLMRRQGEGGKGGNAK